MHEETFEFIGNLGEFEVRCGGRLGVGLRDFSCFENIQLRKRSKSFTVIGFSPHPGRLFVGRSS